MQKACSLSSVRERNTPRLESHTSWISSTMTYSTWANFSRNFGAAITSARDSGVVMRMCGGLRSIFCRSAWEVSPVLTPTRMSGKSMPSAAATSRMPASGSLRLRLMSLARAFSGDTYMAYIRSSSFPSWEYLNSSLIMDRNAVSVLPEPVGDDTRTLLRSWMSGMAYDCGSVKSLKRESNHLAMSGSRSLMTSSLVWRLVTLFMILPLGS